MTPNHGVSTIYIHVFCALAVAEALSNVKDSNVSERFRELFLPDGQPPLSGLFMRRLDLAAILDAVAARGVSEFYSGNLTQEMVAEVGTFLKKRGWNQSSHFGFSSALLMMMMMMRTSVHRYLPCDCVLEVAVLVSWCTLTATAASIPSSWSNPEPQNNWDTLHLGFQGTFSLKVVMSIILFVFHLFQNITLLTMKEYRAHICRSRVLVQIFTKIQTKTQAQYRLWEMLGKNSNNVVYLHDVQSL